MIRSSSYPTGVTLQRDPFLNKGTSFSEEERDRLGLRGLVPPRVNSLEEQVQRVLGNLRQKPHDLDRYIFMMSLLERNTTLFYRVLVDHMAEFMPIVYTPTVGQACLEYGHLFRRSHGFFVSANDRGHIARILRNWPIDDVRVIVVTDGERILGLGDLGVNGLGIPVGKLTLYTACAGIHPSYCLPITLDVGTNNESLLNDPMYIGLPQHRLRGAAYDELFEELITALMLHFPHALVQMEDFGNTNAFRFLDSYRNRLCLFNDDIQGTGAVALAGLYAALRVTGQALRDQKIVFLGAGEAALGIGDIVTAALMEEGLSQEEARRRCWFVDSKGLVVKSRTDLVGHKLPYAHEHDFLPDLLSAVESLRPTAIIGVAGQPGTFTQEVVQAMARFNTRPIIFAMSNPTSKQECSATDAYTWTDGRAIFTSGSPSAPVKLNGNTIVPGQGNNAYIFPGLGLGIVAYGITRVTDEMFLAAAKALAAQVSEQDLARGTMYPPLQRIRDVSVTIAEAVAEVAYQQGLATQARPADQQAYIREHMYVPEYDSYV